MGKIEKIEQEVPALSPEALAQFRAWFLECHASPDFCRPDPASASGSYS
jgi:hypothetical protein